MGGCPLHGVGSPPLLGSPAIPRTFLRVVKAILITFRGGGVQLILSRQFLELQKFFDSGI